MRIRSGLSPFRAFCLGLFLLVPGVLNAQRLTGNIKGTVMDETGVPLPGVTVEISSPELMGGSHSQTTDEKGLYRFVNLPPGIYQMVFSLPGFQKIEQTDVRVSVKGTITLDIIMKPATLEESVTVRAQSPIVDVTSSGVSTNYDRNLLEKIPSGRFSFLDVVKRPGYKRQALVLRLCEHHPQ